MEQYRCLCCGHKTLEKRGELEICPVCFWGDEPYPGLTGEPDDTRLLGTEGLLDIPSAANHGLTLRMGRENFHAFGASDSKMLPRPRRHAPRKKRGAD